MKGRLAILTLSRNADYLCRLTSALDAQVVAPPTIRVLVNNAVGPRGEALVEAALNGRWVSLAYGRNLSFAEGNNRAASLASQVAEDVSHFLLVNDDACPRPDTLGRLWRSRYRGDVVGTMILNSDGTVNHAGHDPRLADPHLGRGDDPAKWQNGIAEVPCVTFACALVARPLWEHLGGLHTGYWYGFEDTDFCVRARAAGARIVCQRNAVVEHDECGTRPRGGQRDVENARLFSERCGHLLGELNAEG